MHAHTYFKIHIYIHKYMKKRVTGLRCLLVSYKCITGDEKRGNFVVCTVVYTSFHLFLSLVFIFVFVCVLVFVFVFV